MLPTLNTSSRCCVQLVEYNFLLLPVVILNSICALPNGSGCSSGEERTSPAFLSCEGWRAWEGFPTCLPDPSVYPSLTPCSFWCYRGAQAAMSRLISLIQRSASSLQQALLWLDREAPGSLPKGHGVRGAAPSVTSMAGANSSEVGLPLQQQLGHSASHHSGEETPL